MEYRRFGRTELAMPVFSCGGMRYQHQWKDGLLADIPSASQQNLEETIRRAVDVGINHIETARGYGTSEIQLGQVLPLLPRNSLIVQTKVSPTQDPQEFRQTLERSLTNLRLEQVDLLGIHGINTPELLEWTLKPGGCLEVAQEFQRQGRVRFIGFSTHAPTSVIVEAIATNQFDYVNLHWYYINQQNWDAIEAATRHDMGVFIISPSDKGGMLYKPPQKLVDLCAPLSPIVFNDLFCLSHPQVHTLSIGAARPDDFDEHLKALPLLGQVETLLPPILERLEAEAIRILGKDWFTSWEEGLPNLEDVPGRVNVRMILWLRNLTLAYDMVDYARVRYNMLGNASHWFPGAKADTLDPQALKPYLRNSPHADQIPELLAEAHDLLGSEAVKRLSQQ